MWAHLEAHPRHNGNVWTFNESSTCQYQSSSDGVSITVVVSFGETLGSRRSARGRAEKALFADSVTRWLIGTDPKWTLDLVELHKFILATSKPNRGEYDFLIGEAIVEPEVEVVSNERFGRTEYVGLVTVYITPDSIRPPHSIMPPPSISESLKRFEAEHPDPSKCAFLMMRFGKTTAHTNIVKAIRETLAAYGIAGLRADDRDYHDDLFPNVETYMYGCGFGIAIFERIESQEFNPNVGLEVGYMMAMGKPVCLLKDRTLTALQTDLVGKLYKQFDVLDPAKTIPDQLNAWLSNRGFIPLDNLSASERLAATLREAELQKAEVLRETEQKLTDFLKLLESTDNTEKSNAVSTDDG